MYGVRRGLRTAGAVHLSGYSVGWVFGNLAFMSYFVIKMYLEYFCAEHELSGAK